MKNPYVLFRIQAVFWVILLVSVLSQSSITLFGKQIFLAVILGVVLLPIVEIITWPAAKLAPSRPWRNYFLGFRWIGWTLWILNLFFAWSLIKIQSD
jgi:hypothetical protein